MSFVKGQAPGPGRPKGSKSKSFLTLTYWFNELEKDWPKLKPAQRAKLSAQLMQMLVNKLKQLPSSPEDSLTNANESMQVLEELEVKIRDLSKGQVNIIDAIGKELGPINPPPPESKP